MKIKFGAIVVDGRGKLGGQDFLKSRQGVNLRTKPIHTRKESQANSRRKTIFLSLQQAWRTLTEADRRAWTSFANENVQFTGFYGKKHLSGIQSFQQMNYNLLLTDNPYNSTPPTLVTLGDYSFDYFVTYGDNMPFLIALAPTLAPGEGVKIFATAPHSQGITAGNKNFKLIEILTSSIQFPYDIWPSYSSVFGSVGSTGTIIRLKCITFSYVTGQESAPFYPAGQLPAMYTTDITNHRILGYNKLSNHVLPPADFVLLQPSWTANSPGVGTDVTPVNCWFADCAIGQGLKLFIADRNHQRVLIYNKLPNGRNDKPDIVLGQNDMFHGAIPPTEPPTQTSLAYPTYASSDGIHLFVSDQNNNRVLIWNSIPTSNNQPADVVLGQADFVSYLGNRGGSPGSNTLKRPSFVIYSGQKLWVGDYENNRILVWNSIPTANGQPANFVIGQENFSGGSPNQGSTCDSDTLDSPRGAFVHNHKLYIADQDNHRILVFDPVPTTTNPDADYCFGQTNLQNNSKYQGGAAGPNNLNKPRIPTFIGNTMLLPDKGSSRILIFDTIPAGFNPSADRVIGQPNLISVVKNYGGNTARNNMTNPTSTWLMQYT